MGKVGRWFRSRTDLDQVALVSIAILLLIWGIIQGPYLVDALSLPPLVPSDITSATITYAEDIPNGNYSDLFQYTYTRTISNHANVKSLIDALNELHPWHDLIQADYWNGDKNPRYTIVLNSMSKGQTTVKVDRISACTARTGTADTCRRVWDDDHAHALTSLLASLQLKNIYDTRAVSKVQL